RLLGHFGPSERKARAGQLEVYLGLLEVPRPRGKAQTFSEVQVRSEIQNVVRGQLQEEALRPDTWASLADVYGVLKPGNQTLRSYRLEEIAGRAQGRLEIEDLLQIRALEISLELDRNSVYHRNTLADLAWQQGLREYAKKQYIEVVTILPELDQHPFVASGNVSDEMEELVVFSLHRAMRPPRNAPRETVYRVLGQFLFTQRKYREAYDAFQKSQDVAGRSTASWKALAAGMQGHVDEAIALDREAMVAEDLAPENRFYVLAHLGGHLEAKGRLREAAEAFRSALVIKPHNPGILNQLGRVYESMGLWQDAEDCFIRASEIGSERITNLAQLVLFYRRIGKPEMALAPARKLVQMEPEESLYRKQIEEIEADIENERR
ncbi:MAG: tetratricopeptide repeat protein, partial [Acidobacteria bacterium]|nr:tetratricopeptide repeat protein [Acidobacteriota bacterium]